MPRLPRLKPRDRDQSYHLYNRVAGEPGRYPLQRPGAREELMKILLFYADVYFCVLVAFAILGNHYHAVVRFEVFRELTRVELRALAERLYKGRIFKPYLFWGARQWRRFNQRLFDVSEFMRNVESDYAVWYNRQFGRRGQLWADRFKSNLLESLRAVQAVALYVELNPVRAHLCGRPEHYAYGSAKLRLANVRRSWLMTLTELWGCPDARRALKIHFGCLQHRGGMKIENEEEFLRAILRQDEEAGYKAGMYQEHQRYMNDALAMGDEAQIQALRDGLVARGVYRRSRSPVRGPGDLRLLRSQRRPADTTGSKKAA